MLAPACPSLFRLRRRSTSLSVALRHFGSQHSNFAAQQSQQLDCRHSVRLHQFRKTWPRNMNQFGTFHRFRCK